MAERPILFSGPMVRAILSGNKTQTRRVVKRELVGQFDVPRGHADTANGYPFIEDAYGERRRAVEFCPYGQIGDRLWVRETWRECDDDDIGTCIELRADHARFKPKFPTPGDGWRTQQNSIATDAHRWRPSIFMPRWASRFTLQLTCRRLEQVRHISEADAIAEGVVQTGGGRYWVAAHDQGFKPRGSAVMAYQDLWDSINAKRGLGWETNPWVWVLEFKRVEVGE